MEIEKWTIVESMGLESLVVVKSFVAGELGLQRLMGKKDKGYGESECVRERYFMFVLKEERD